MTQTERMYKEVGYHLAMARGKAVSLPNQAERSALISKIDVAQEFLEYLDNNVYSQ